MKKGLCKKLGKIRLVILPLLSLLPIILCWPDSLKALPLKEEEVKAAVLTWVRNIPADARPDAVIEKMEAHVVDGEALAYIVHLAGGGFCIAGADDLVLPVYIYNPIGNYSLNKAPYQHFLEEVAGRTNHMRRLTTDRSAVLLDYQSLISERSQYWQALIQAQIPVKVKMPGDAIITQMTVPDVMVLGLTSQWHQVSPYNDQTPPHPFASQHTLVGCNATAAAQIMYYWKWPNTGLGSRNATYIYRWRNGWDSEPLASNPNISDPYWAGRLQWTNVGGGQLQMNGNWDDSIYRAAQAISADTQYRTALNNLWLRLNTAAGFYTVNFTNATYNWQLMKDVHPDTTAGDAEVAKLSYHAGVAGESSYGLLITTGNIASWRLPEHFRYDNNFLFYSERNPDTINYLTEEINWLRPVALGGSNASGGGHAYIVYGYDKRTDPNRKFLMNMGGAPADSAVWYTLDTTPFPLTQDHGIYIAPADVVRFVGSTTSGNGSPATPHRDVEEAVNSAPHYATLIFKAGSTNTFSSPTLVINKPLILKGKNIEITRINQ